ncbi:MAG: family 43 glycosylhydrolase [Rikenellaceae bacterium]|nr:family 43 glycosylhydrolase [Rikenellaceae bacterium]
MKKLIFATALLLLIGAAGCTPKATETLTVSRLSYTGQDTLFEGEIDPATHYRNPILAGFYPDPSICRKGEDYFLVCSSFAYWPAIPIFHSRDLVHWQSLGHVIDRPSQLTLKEGLRLSGGIYAPAITYNPHTELFYLITTDVDGIGNFVVTTPDPRTTPWSDPIPLPKVGGIDPSLFFDEDGRGYLVHNDAPAAEPQWDGHRAIWLHEFDGATCTTVGERRLILDGGIDPATKPVWIEGPHLYKIEGRYYLMAAEGGTSVNHSEVILSAERPEGPYTAAPHNPILTQRDLSENRPNKITSVGHADLIETPDGAWYVLFLGCRPYESNHYHTGRESFLLPVTWSEGYPTILPRGEAVPIVVEKRDLQPAGEPLTGNFRWQTDFAEGLASRFLMVRTPQSAFYTTDRHGLHITPTDRLITNKTNPAFVGIRQQHTAFETEIELLYNPSEGAFGGLCCFQNEAHHLLFGLTRSQGMPQLIVQRVAQGEKELLVAVPLDERMVRKPITLRLIGNGAWITLQAEADRATFEPITELYASFLSTESAGGFTGVVIGPYAATAL